MSSAFSDNLRSLCAEYKSIAEVCRKIGINRQQFNRYLNGSGMPSANNLRSIARHFGMPEAELFLDTKTFNQRHIENLPRSNRTPIDVMTGVFQNQAKDLRRYLGFYHGHFCSPAWEKHIMRTLIWLREQDGYVVGHTFERATTPDGSVRQKTRYSGLVTYRGNRIYMIENAFSDDGFISESILFPAHRQQIKFLRGLTLGVATRPRLAPYTSRCIWKKISQRVSAREALEATGVFPVDSTKIDVTVRKFLFDQDETVSTISVSSDLF